MKFSTRTTYGLRAMTNLARNWGNGTISLHNIADKEKISLGYLERLFAKLKRANLVKAEKGVAGGYSLSRRPGQIAVYDIVKVLEGNMASFNCLSDNGKADCELKDSCGAVKVLTKVQKAINLTLESIKLDDLI